MLFQSLSQPDRTKTQLAYAAQYMPLRELDDEALRLIVWSRKVMMRKGTVVALLNEDMTTIRAFENQEFEIKWRFNAIPTEIEWERKSLGYIIEIDLRIIKGIGKVALFSF